MTINQRYGLPICVEAAPIQGFTMTEVLVGIFLTLIGGLVLLSTIVYATAVNVRSQHQSFALKWIQEDIEQVKAAAANWSFGFISSSAGTLQLSGCSSSTCGLSVNDQIRLRDAGVIHRVSSISGSTIVLSPPVSIPSSASRGFIPLSKCLATATTNGLGNALKSDLSSLVPVPSNTYTWKGVTYVLSRRGYGAASTPTVRNVAPFNILQLTYRVSPTSGSGDTFTLSTEILPSAALQCP
ncbi:MAG: hypothetical protein AAGB01_06260 [Cyanobacteria bacterium P01_F01_bin.42]